MKFTWLAAAETQKINFEILKFKGKPKIDDNLWSIRKNEIRQELVHLQLDGY